MEIVEVPAGVPGLLGVVLPPVPPHPMKETLTPHAIVNSAMVWNNRRQRRLSLARTSPRKLTRLITVPAGSHGSLVGTAA
jgi:hypothetical protein